MNPTLSGIAAIIMWSLLALFTASSGKVPPFQLLAMTFALGSLVGVFSWGFRRPAKDAFRQPLKVWCVGIAGLFGYHFFYYSALRNAPVAEASLIAYLWPLLIVLFSALLPGERFRVYHGLGAILGFGGAVLLLLSGSPIGSDGFSYTGYASALLCALIWSTYSVLSRTFKDVSTDVVVVYCLATAGLSLVCHVLLEQTQWPDSPGQWSAIAALGLLPVGLSFYAWDHAMKHGPIQLLGSVAYFAPVLSTIILVLANKAEPTWQLLAATMMVAAGAIVASGRLFKT